MPRFLTPDGHVEDEFAALMVKLAAAFPTARLTEATIRVYARALSDLTYPQLHQIFGRAVRECKFLPSVAELLSYVSATADDAALLAWTALSQAASRVGLYASLEIEDRCAAEALRQVFGSWPHYCSLDSAAVNQRRGEFLAAYRDARRHTVRQAATTSIRMPGLLEIGGAPPGRQVAIGRLERSGAVRLLIVGDTSHHAQERRGLPEGRDAEDDQGPQTPAGVRRDRA